jgi:hypothetical protein
LKIQNIVKIGQTYRALYTEAYAGFIAAGDINSPIKHYTAESDE